MKTKQNKNVKASRYFHGLFEDNQCSNDIFGRNLEKTAKL